MKQEAPTYMGFQIHSHLLSLRCLREGMRDGPGGVAWGSTPFSLFHERGNFPIPETLVFYLRRVNVSVR